MAENSLTLFSWGYRGWGNATSHFVEAVDAVERARGWGPPMFVDVRASRKVRAIGFREGAFEKRFGPSRYRWIPDLGNEAIVTGARRTKLIDPDAAGELLDAAAGLAGQKRRLIFFCACVSPSASCHRNLVADELLKEAGRRGPKATVVEWPGPEDEPAQPHMVELDPAVMKKLAKVPGSIPLGSNLPDVKWLSLPWYSVLRFESATLSGFLYSGPAQYSTRGWELPFQGAEPNLEKAKKQMLAWQEEGCVLPRRSK